MQSVGLRRIGALAAAFALVSHAPSATATPVLTPLVTDLGGQHSPTEDGKYLAWSDTSLVDGIRMTNAMVRSGDDSAYQINPVDTQGFVGDIEGSKLIYQLVRGKDSRVRIVDLRNGSVSIPHGVNSDLWEWGPAMSGD